jgi:hypothetical protein
LFLRHLQHQELQEPAPAFSAASQSSIDGQQGPASKDLGNARLVARLPVNSPAARALSTQHALLPAVILREALAHPVRDPDSAHVPASEHHVRALAHALAPAEHRRLGKLRVRSAPRRVAVAVASNSTPRPKKAR